MEENSNQRLRKFQINFFWQPYVGKQEPRTQSQLSFSVGNYPFNNNEGDS